MAKDRTVTENKEVEKKREPFTIDIEDKIEFSLSSTSKIDFRTTNEICLLTNEIFKNAYDDFEGSTFEINPYDNSMSISLYFNHRDYNTNDEDTVVAFTRDIEDEKYQNKTLSRVKRQNRIYREGINHYNITRDGREGLSKFILPMFKNARDGKVNWNKCVMDVAQPNNTQITLSKVLGIDPCKIFEMVYGSKKGEVNYTYSMFINRSVPAGGYLMTIMQIDSVQLDRALRKAGITNPNGLGIVK